MSVSINTVRPYKNGKTPKLKTLVEAQFKQVLLEKMSKGFPDIVDAMISASTGFEKDVISKTGELLTVKDSPDTQAAKLLFEYTLEKPKQSVELKGTVGIVHLIAQLEHGDNDEEN